MRCAALRLSCRRRFDREIHSPQTIDPPTHGRRDAVEDVLCTRCPPPVRHRAPQGVTWPGTAASHRPLMLGIMRICMWVEFRTTVCGCSHGRSTSDRTRRQL